MNVLARVGVRVRAPPPGRAFTWTVDRTGHSSARGTGLLLSNEPSALRSHMDMVDQWTGGPVQPGAPGSFVSVYIGLVMALPTFSRSPPDRWSDGAPCADPCWLLAPASGDTSNNVLALAATVATAGRR